MLAILNGDEVQSSANSIGDGYTKKTVKTQLGEVDIKVPRDRNGSFEPKIISKYSRNADGMEEKILSLYSCGMSQQDIAEQIEAVYPFIFMDAIHYKVREDHRYVTKAAYVVFPLHIAGYFSYYFRTVV